VSTSTSHGMTGSGLAARVAVPAVAQVVAATMPRRSSVQPTRRAVLYLQAPGDQAAPPELASWFAERAFHFYVAGLRLPPTVALSARHAGRELRSALAEVDAACRRLRRADGMASVIVTAHGRAAVAVALWADSLSRGDDGRARPPAGRRVAGRGGADAVRQRSGADALILTAPAWPRGSLHLSIACPVLVIAGHDSSPAADRAWLRRTRGSGASLQLGSHVTWLALPGVNASASAAPQRFLEELGRWLGAYMYGPVRDQLL
jgi:hypothetical protein